MSRSPFGGTVPHDLDAEAAVLGGILRRNDALARMPTLEVPDFYSPKHQAVFTAIRNLEAKLAPFDEVTVCGELERMGRLEAVGGYAFLGELTLRVPSLENTEHYAQILGEHRMSRDVLRAMDDVAADIREGHAVGSEAVRLAVQHLMSVEARLPDPGRELGQLMLEEMASIERDLAALDRGETISVGMPIGVESLDNETGGWPIGSVAAVLGATGHGKSTLIGTSAKAVSANDGLALVYSCEDPSKFWAQRAIAQESGVPTEAIARRRWLHARMTALADAATRAGGRREIIIPAARWSMRDVIRDARARRLRDQAKHGRKRGCAVFVDYVQVLRIEVGKNQTREQGIAQAMDEASWLAQGCGSNDAADQCAVIMSSQVKQVVIDEERAPRMNDGADSFSIGKVSKFMLGINRPAKYDSKLDPTHGYLDVLKRNQGDDSVSFEVELHLSTHTIRAWSRQSGGPQQALGLPEENHHGH